MRVVASLVLSFALIAAARGPSPATSLPATANEDGRKSVVIVSARMGPHRDAIGAGVIVALLPRGVRVLTARHLTDQGDVTVWIDGIGYAADGVRTLAHRDLAIVDASVPNFARAGVAPATVARDVADDDPIVVWGEDDAGLHINDARVVTARYTDYGDAAAPPLIAIECSRCDHGDSGGGLFSAAGHLIGILVARFVTHDHRIIATVAESVDPAMFAPDASAPQAMATASASTVRSQNEPKLSPD